MKILILYDTQNNWALHNRAKAIKKFLPQHEIDIKPALGNADECLHDHATFDIIHFNFTWGITSFTDFIMNNINRCLLTIVNERSFLQGTGVDLPQLKKIFKTAKYMTSVNRKMADMLGATYIPNGIDTDLFHCTGRPVVGYAGTTRPNKNLHIVEKACKDLGLEIKIAAYKSDIAPPTYTHEEMKKFYDDIDVYVHASGTEGFNNTIIEALACNVPVLMTREGAWKEFSGWVRFIDPDTESLKEGLKMFTGQRLVSDKFLWKDIIPGYEKIYQRIYEDNHRV